VRGAFLRRRRNVATLRLLRLKSLPRARGMSALARGTLLGSRAEDRGETRLWSLGSSFRLPLPRWLAGQETPCEVEAFDFNAAR
jgi:hypothetical protein